MKLDRSVIVSLCVMPAALMVAGLARAAVIGPVTPIPTPGSVLVDEFGGGFIAPPAGGVFPLTSASGTSFVPDPGPGGLPGVLSYGLPFPVIPGDVVLTEPGTSQGPSDLIRFLPDPTGGNTSRLYFYSDVSPSDPADVTADIGMPAAFITPALVFIEIGAEGGLNGLDYSPAAGDPGFDPTGSITTYHLVSDSVPEPASLSLLALGGGMLLLRRRR